MINYLIHKLKAKTYYTPYGGVKTEISFPHEPKLAKTSSISDKKGRTKFYYTSKIRKKKQSIKTEWVDQIWIKWTKLQYS